MVCMRTTYLQLLLNVVSCQVLYRCSRLALDGSASHIPGQHSSKDCQGQQGPVATRYHGGHVVGSKYPDMGVEGEGGRMLKMQGRQLYMYCSLASGQVRWSAYR